MATRSAKETIRKQLAQAIAARLEHIRTAEGELLKQEELADIPGEIERSLERSLKRLRRERVDVLQFHNHLGVGPRHVSESQMLGPKGVAETLARLKAQGLIRAMGLTAAGDTAACIQVIESGAFDTAQVYYNLLNPSAAWSHVPVPWTGQNFSGVMAACQKQHMGILNIRVFAGGSLASPVRHGREFVMAAGADLDAEARRAAQVAQVLGEGYGSLAQAALRFCLGDARISTCVIGLAELAHLELALLAAAAGPLPGEAIEQLGTVWSRDFAAP